TPGRVSCTPMGMMDAHPGEPGPARERLQATPAVFGQLGARVDTERAEQTLVDLQRPRYTTGDTRRPQGSPRRSAPALRAGLLRWSCCEQWRWRGVYRRDHGADRLQDRRGCGAPRPG